MRDLTISQSKPFVACLTSIALPTLAILFPATLAAFKLAEFLHSDGILFQIMSLHNATLFYWWQNRLLNVIPFILQPATSPLLNIFLVIFSCSLSFFLLLWLISCMAQRIIINTKNSLFTFIVYTFNVVICIFFLTERGWVSMALSHPEYSLAFALGILTIFLFYLSPYKFSVPALIVGFLSLGINPAVILIFGFFIFFKWSIFHKISRKDIIFSASLISFFLIWIFISMQYGSVDNYYHLNLYKILPGFKKFIIRFTESFISSHPLYIVGIYILLFLIAILSSKRLPNVQRSEIVYVSIAGILSIFIYSLIISCVPHYNEGGFYPDYFIFDWFIFLFVLSFNFAVFINHSSTKINKIFILCSLIFCCSLIFFYPKDFNIRNANVYKNCDEIITSGTHFYAGDYWKIWACMSRDMIDGYDSRSLGFRSLADKQNIQK
ncbi:MAG: hypothetical protein HDR50_09900 [Desulfovibrio sp.]|uniref:hypothetical protein n=1 Tax=Desulfovibrio sp. TaxID=885 RepID=UPI001A65A371|nr:hypothetical protein [Desulfovibrio sp.]MBD5417941.1 hypothetical protein [Desulfovibrio sp.]